ncbi:Peroxidase [Actinobacteria bacterium OK074]|nr:Peroxidase [Actinobacteria bacterium OK074]
MVDKVDLTEPVAPVGGVDGESSDDRFDDHAEPADLFDDRFWRDPYPLYARLRRAAPVRPVVTPDGLRMWLVTRYEDARGLLSDPRLSKDLSTAGPLFRRHTAEGTVARYDNSAVSKHMLRVDPPDHTRLRKLVGKAFTPRRVERLRPRVEAVSAQLLDAVEGRGEVDLVGEYAFRIAITVICELLGLPGDDQEQFRVWTQDYNDTGHPERYTAASHAIAGYVTELIADKRRHPGDDLMSALIEASDAEDRLSSDELVATVFLLLSAGHETTVNLIANGMLALVDHPEQMSQLRGDPGLLPSAVEEFLRYDSPVNTSTYRYTTEPVTVGEVTVPEGEFVLVALASANRDPGRFTEPDRLDITRSAQGHVSFGHGIHYCLGAPLARQEAEVAFGDWLKRYGSIELAHPDEALTYRHSLLMRGPVALPLRVTPA